MEASSFTSRAEPFLIQPKHEHKQTFILLHGRGDRADTFGADLLSTYLPTEVTLRLLYPGAKFVFLQAPLTELASWPGTKFYQWFDVPNLAPGSEEAELQIPGLSDTIQLIHGTLRQEIESVGAENVVLGGLSQGCASSLISLLLWDGPPFAACIGMSGWLPFRAVMESALGSRDIGMPDDTVERRDGLTSIAALGRRLGYPDSFSAPDAYKQIPVFLGHGTQDDVVVNLLGREAARCISAMGSDVVYKDYEGLDHWYSSLMLQDITEFLDSKTQVHTAT